MKTIDEIIKRTPPEKLKDISGLMESKNTSEQKIKESYTNIFCLNRLLKNLNGEELAILRLLYSGNDGISFSDIQKNLNISIDTIETCTTALSGYMLVYVNKNRQMLNKKMDKLYCIHEVAETLKISSTQEILDHLHKIEENWAEKKQGVQLPKIDDKLKTVMIMISARGGIIPVGELSAGLQSPELEQKASDACNSGQLFTFNVITEKHEAFIAIHPSITAYISSLKKSGNISPGINVNNGYNLAVNLLLAYDVISSSGLFLTKQNKFRKIDLKKISDSLLPLKSTEAEQIPEEDSSMLILQLLNIMGCLRLERDIGIISLKPVADIIDDPVLLLKFAASKMAGVKKMDDIFNGTVQIPDPYDLKTTISLISRIKSSDLNYLKYAFMTAKVSLLIKKNGEINESQALNDEESFSTCLEFLTLSGVTGISDGLVFLTEQGKRLHAALYGKKYMKESDPVKCIYISPDFTLMIPDKDIDSSSLYLVMAYTEIIKQDVVIEAAITKSSIINASKRGMNFERFISTLRRYAKNDIPQNLEFLLDDWTKQTISINISRPVLLYSSHPAYIDELLYSSTSKAVRERISENHIIIDKNYIDDVIRFSKKHDVRLNIFEDED